MRPEDLDQYDQCPIDGGGSAGHDRFMSSANEEWRDDIPDLHVLEDVLPAPGRSRRQFPAEYKLAIVEEYDSCNGVGEKTALLRREGLHNSIIQEWRRARDAAFDRAGLIRDLPIDQGSSSPPDDRSSHERLALILAIRRIRELESELERVRLLVDVQGSAHALLEMIARHPQLIEKVD